MAPKTFARTEKQQILDDHGQPLILKGVGIGSWLLPEGYMFDFIKNPYSSPRGLQQLSDELIGPEASQQFWKTFRQHFFTVEDVAIIARDGYNSIRIPFDWKVLFTPDLQMIEENFKLMDEVIDACTEHHLWVILDLHGAPGGQNGTNIDDGHGHPWLFESELAQRQTVELWKKIAFRYRNNTTVLGYDLLNEPLPKNHDRYNSRLEPLYRRITEAIRSVDPHHIIILEGANWATDFSVFGAPFDDQLVYQFHKYWNANDDETIQEFLDFRDKYQVPLWNGETGENKLDWYRDCSRLMEKHSIGWNMWPYKKFAENPSPYHIQFPPEWQAVKTYTQTGVRPALGIAKLAFDKLSEAIKTQHCERQEGAIQAWLKP